MTRELTARLAGFLYLATLPTAGFAYGFVEFMPRGNDAQTLAWFTANRQVLAWTVLAGSTGFVFSLFIGLLLRRVLAPTSKFLGDPMLLLAAAGVPLSLVAMADRIDLLALIDAAPPQLLPEAMLHLQRGHNLLTVSASFWGLWLLPLAWQFGARPELRLCVHRADDVGRAGVRTVDPCVGGAEIRGRGEQRLTTAMRLPYY